MPPGHVQSSDWAPNGALHLICGQRALPHLPTLNEYKAVCGTHLQSSWHQLATEQGRIRSGFRIDGPHAHLSHLWLAMALGASARWGLHGVHQASKFTNTSSLESIDGGVV